MPGLFVNPTSRPLAWAGDNPAPLLYPYVTGRIQGANDTAQTPQVPTLPAGIVPGELLLVCLANDNANTTPSTSSTGWSLLATQAQGSTTNHTGSIFYKFATGSDALSVDLGGAGGAQEVTWTSYRIANAGTPTAAGSNGAATTSVSMPTLAPTFSNYLTLLAVMTDSSAGLTQSAAWPAGWINPIGLNPGVTSSAATFSAEQLLLNTVSSITPGTLTLGLSEQYVAFTVAIPPRLTPGTLLNIGPGGTQNHFRVQVAPIGGGSQVDHDQAEIAAGYVEDPYFLVAPGGARAQFYARLDGPLSSGAAGGSRSELRETDAAGTAAAWDALVGGHVYQFTTRAIHLPPVDPACVLTQLHDGGDGDRISIRTQLSSGVIRLICKINGTSIGYPVLANPYLLGTDLTVKLVIDGGGFVDVYYQDLATPVISHAGPLISTAASGTATWYWKTGAYNQSSTDVGTEYSAVEVTSISYAHTTATFTKTGGGAVGGAAAGSKVVRLGPASVGTIGNWWAADAVSQTDGTTVNPWPGNISTAEDATNAFAANRATYKTAIVNGRPVLRFDGTDSYLSAANTSIPQTTLFAVVRPTTITAYQTIRGSNIAGGLQWRLNNAGKSELVKESQAGIGTANTAVSTSVFSILSAAHADASTYAFYLNGTADGSGSHAVTLVGGATTEIAKNTDQNGEYLVGDLAELIVYVGVLSAGDRAKVHSYLSDKYGITVSDYVAPPPPSTVYTKAGTGVAGTAAAGDQDTTRVKAGLGAGAGVGAGAKVLTSPQVVYTKAGLGAAAGAPAGVETVAHPQTTFTKAGLGAAVGTGLLAKSVTRVKAGLGAATGAPAGTETVIRLKTASAAAIGAPAGTTFVTRVKAGLGAAAGAPAGVQTVLHPQTTFTKAGTGAAVAVAAGGKTVTTVRTVTVVASAVAAGTETTTRFKTASAAAVGAPAGAKSVTRVKAGLGAAAGAPAGTETTTRFKTASAVATATGSGGKTVTTVRAVTGAASGTALVAKSVTRVKAGTGAAAGAPAGVQTVTSLQTVITKTGAGVAAGVGRGTSGVRLSPSFAVPGLVAWWAADNLAQGDGTAVASWANLAGPVGVASQGTGADRPTFKTNIVNGKPVLRFDGTDSLTSAADASPLLTTIFAVVRPTSTAGYQTIRGSFGTGGLQFRLGLGKPELINQTISLVGTAAATVSTAAFTVCSASYADAATYALYVNGATSASGFHSVTLTPGRPTEIGHYEPSNAELLTGDLAELIVYNAVLSAPDRAKIHSYLSDKYAITVTDYVAAPAPVIERTTTGLGAAAGTASGGKTVTTVRTVTAAAVGAGSGAKTMLSPQVVYPKAGLGAAAGVGSGAKTVLHPQTTFTKAGLGAAAGTGAGTQLALGVPQQVGTLANWFRADSLALSDGAAVSAWADSTGPAGVATQADGAAQPTFKTGIVNGKPVLRFDGGDWLATLANSSIQHTTIFAVVRPTSTAGYQAIRGSSNAGGLEWRLGLGYPELVKQGIAVVGTSTTILPTASFSIISTDFDDASSYAFYYNGATAASGTTTVALTVAAYSTEIGRITNEYLTGDLAELIVYHVAVLSAADRARVHTYLSDKYGIAVADRVGQIIKTGLGAAAGTGSGAKTITSPQTVYTKAGTGAAALVGAGAKSVTRVKMAAAVAAGTGSGTKTVTSTRAGLGATAGVAAGAKSVTSVRAATAVARPTGAGVQVRISGAVVVKAGSAAVAAVGSGVAARTSAATITTAGTGAASTVGAGTQSVLTATAIVKAGLGATGATAAGTQALSSPQVIQTKAGTGTAAPTASGVQVVGGAAVLVTAGVAAVEAVGRGYQLVVTPQIVYTKAGDGWATPTASGTQLVAHPQAVYTKAGVGAAVGTGGGAPEIQGAGQIVTAGAGVAAAVGSGTRAMVLVKPGTAAAVGVGAGAQTIAHPQITATKAGSAAAAGTAAGTAAVAPATTYVKTVSVVVAATGSGVKALQFPGVIVKAGLGAAPVVGAGTRSMVLIKPGTAIAAAVGAGVKVRELTAKPGAGIATGASTGAKVRELADRPGRGVAIGVASGRKGRDYGRTGTAAAAACAAGPRVRLYQRITTAAARPVAVGGTDRGPRAHRVGYGDTVRPGTGRTPRGTAGAVSRGASGRVPRVPAGAAGRPAGAYDG